MSDGTTPGDMAVPGFAAVPGKCEIDGCIEAAIALYFPVYEKATGGWGFLEPAPSKICMALCRRHLPAPPIHVPDGDSMPVG